MLRELRPKQYFDRVLKTKVLFNIIQMSSETISIIYNIVIKQKYTKSAENICYNVNNFVFIVESILYIEIYTSIFAIYFVISIYSNVPAFNILILTSSIRRMT